MMNTSKIGMYALYEYESDWSVVSDFVVCMHIRNFISPHILKMEYGLANEMEQYETKYKARQLLGHVEADSKKNKMSKKGSIVGTSYFSKMVSGFQ